MFSGAILVLLFVYCSTSVVCLGPPLKNAVTCSFGYRVRPEANGKTQGMCTIKHTTDDYACEGCKANVPLGLQCVEAKYDVPLANLKQSHQNISCPNYEKLMPNGVFVGYGCAEPRQGQKARCFDIQDPGLFFHRSTPWVISNKRTTCPAGACRLNIP
ncbi:uncharacterized protein MELLADRAFT_88618 [Melampsora larici-populina 98AG31]|uniref:Secreted protein n=1 Tax=Melampsora larici-populina (strain 98AG31 / pathotype 3-4-7) TaxID=747676 RepID=F4RSD5_MELLP|nr:uncharacterized protein MELLADRAFT_88618 [Melampsora larici-populina 98AG31]EGG04711.1 secreted protein [Melampsora larici-populina 98AG31]